MKSFRLHEWGKPLVWENREQPQPQGREVLLKVTACGVCHSDLHFWEGQYDLGEGQRLYVKDRGVKLPLTMGHEIAGEVVALGPQAQGAAIGDIRLVYPWHGCGQCYYCRREEENLCYKPRSLGVFQDGGYSDYLLVSDAKYLVDLGQIDAEHGCCYACAGITAYGALQKVLPLPKEESLLVIGAGGVGLLGLQVLPYICNNRVIVVDVNDQALAEARRFGNYITVNSRQEDAAAAIQKHSDGGVAAAVDFVGLKETAQLGLNSLKKNGILVLVGLFGGSLTFPMPILTTKNLTIAGNYTGSLVQLKELIAILNRHKPPMLPISRRRLSEVGAILQEIKAGKIIGRAILNTQS